MRRFQIMKHSKPDDVVSCNTSYPQRNMMDTYPAIRTLGYGDTPKEVTV